MANNNQSELNRSKSYTSRLYQEAYSELTSFIKSNSKIKPDFTKYNSFRWKFIKLLNDILFSKLGFLIFINTFWEIFLIYFYEIPAKNNALGTTYFGLTQPEKLDYIYDSLEDEKSKEVFNWFIKYRFGYSIIGPMASNVFPFVDYEQNNKITPKKKGNLYTINGHQIDFCHDWNEVKNTWINEQYRIAGKCEPQKNEIIIDAGGFQGSTAIWFANIVGENGKVFSFEPLKSNYQKMKKNIQRNKLEKIVDFINVGLWDGVTDLFITNNNSASTSFDINADIKIEVTTLDEFVQNERLEQVDFIKMDIEGAEMNALRGAEKTILRFKPKLAISIYHLPEDIYEIPFFIKSLVPEYKLYLSHKFHGWHETILFASMD